MVVLWLCGFIGVFGEECEERCGWFGVLEKSWVDKGSGCFRYLNVA